MTRFSRASCSAWLLVALAAGCAKNREPDPGALQTEKAFRISAPGLRIQRTATGGISVELVRGPSSFYSSNQPLYIVDDAPFQPGPGGVLTGVNPHDIESIKLLQNPADTAIYGVRGANGVIIIRTKIPGKSGA